MASILWWIVTCQRKDAAGSSPPCPSPENSHFLIRIILGEIFDLLLLRFRCSNLPQFSSQWSELSRLLHSGFRPKDVSVIFITSVLTDVDVNIYGKVHIRGEVTYNLLVLVLAPGEVHQLRFAGLEEALQLKRLRWSTNSKWPHLPFEVDLQGSCVPEQVVHLVDVQAWKVTSYFWFFKSSPKITNLAKM